MKKIIVLLSFLPVVFCVSAQTSYRTTDSEMIFSFSEVAKSGLTVDTDLRWTVFYHTGTYNNHDLTGNLGIFYGLALRNIGFITNDELIDANFYNVVKRRSYSLGIPVGIKLGNLDDNAFLFGGAEYELLFHYKEKRFIDGTRIYKNRDWFSSRTNRFIPSLFIGVNLKSQMAVTFKYYMGDFMNRSFQESGTGTRPYSQMDSRLFYISLSKKFRYQRLSDLAKVHVLSI
jgi:hypothetical protein